MIEPIYRGVLVPPPSRAFAGDDGGVRKALAGMTVMFSASQAGLQTQVQAGGELL